ncbi:MAG: hypothetical protein JSV10_01285, partial [Candidatus Zixiibacteriota bacterium]
MKRALALLCIGILVFTAPVWAQPNYLIRIDNLDQATIHQIKMSRIEVWAKTADFWIAGASRADLEFLEKEEVVFRMLDREADIGEYYLIRSKPSEEISSKLPEIQARARILDADVDVVVVKGNPRKIEELAWLGFSLRKIHRRSLPLESETEIRPYVEIPRKAYDPLIGDIVSQVDQAQLLSWIDDLSGEDTTQIGGTEDSI